MSKIPRSIIVYQGSLFGGAGNCWSVPVFVFNSEFNDAQAGDEDRIPVDGNPHPLSGQQDQLHQPQPVSDNLEDLDEMQQANMDECWEPIHLPDAAATANLNGVWQTWPEQQCIPVPQAELQKVEESANNLVQEAML